MAVSETMTERVQRLAGAVGTLAVLQVLHLLDELRTEEDRVGIGKLVSPQALLGIGAAALAYWGLRRGKSWALPTAVFTAVGVSVGFLVVHGLPWASERTEPYWGDGSADILQWTGVLAIWVTSIITVGFARDVRAGTAEAAPTPASA